MNEHERRAAEAWADRIAAQLPPFTPEEAAAIGRLAADIDARRARRESSQGGADATHNDG